MAMMLLNYWNQNDAATKIAILYVIQIIFHLWDGKIGGSYKLDHDLDNCGMDIYVSTSFMSCNSEMVELFVCWGVVHW
jgi:hypothetical protein